MIQPHTLHHTPLLLLLYTIILLAQPKKENIAVIDLEGTLSKPQLVTLTDKLVVELINTGKYVVIERSQMQDILTEQGFQQAGCTSSECAVQVGQLLGVDKMLAGSIGKLGKIFSITLRIIDVRTGKIVKTASTDYRGGIEDVLRTGLNEAVSALYASREITDRFPDKGVGDLFINSTPAGGEIYIDDKKSEGIVTPATIENITAGEHLIKVVNGQFIGSEIIDLKRDDLKKIHLTLSKGFGGAKIFTEPAGAQLIVGGRDYGTTPVLIEKLNAGTYHITLSKAGYITYNGFFSVELNRQTKHSISLEPAAYLEINTKPDGATVFLDSTRLDGITPFSNLVEKPGVHRVFIIKPNYDTVQTEVTLEAGKKVTISSTLKYSFGTVTISSKPDNATVFLDTTKVDVTTPLVLPAVSPGHYRVSIVHPKYETKTREIDVEAGAEYTIDEILIPKYATIDISTFRADPDAQPGKDASGNARHEVNIDLEIRNTENSSAPVTTKTPFKSDSVTPGTYALRIHDPRYQEVVDTLQAGKGLQISRKYTIHHTETFLTDSLASVILKKRRSLLKAGTILGGSLAAMSFAAGIFCYNQMNKYHDNYLATQNKTLMDSHYSKSYDFYRYMCISDGAGAVFLIAGGAAFYLLKFRLDDTAVNVRAHAGNNGAALDVVWNLNHRRIK